MIYYINNFFNFFLEIHPEILSSFILFIMNLLIIFIKKINTKKKILMLASSMFIYNLLIINKDIEIIKYLKEIATYITAMITSYLILKPEKKNIIFEKKQINTKKNVHLFLNQLIKIHFLGMQQNSNVTSFICFDLFNEIQVSDSFNIPVDSDIFSLLLHQKSSDHILFYWNTDGFLKYIKIIKHQLTAQSPHTITLYSDLQTKTFTIIFEKELKYLSAGQAINIIEQLLLKKNNCSI